jgi:CheY-like chemotaxis protein
MTIGTHHVFFEEPFDDEFTEPVAPGGYVRLSVADSGIGMDEATRLRAFDPFFTTKESGRGTGLGLSTVHGIVKQSLGFVRIHSEVGRGTTVAIYLPRVDAKAPAPERIVPESVGDAQSGTETILLVEDNTGLRKLTTRILEPAGYKVISADSAENALRECHERDLPIHLLLTDVVLPGLSGRELAEQMRPTHPMMKVLYMSGYTNDEIVRRGVLDASVAFCAKPFTASGLLRRVRTLLDT